MATSERASAFCKYTAVVEKKIDPKAQDLNPMAFPRKTGESVDHESKPLPLVEYRNTEKQSANDWRDLANSSCDFRY